MKRLPFSHPDQTDENEWWAIFLTLVCCVEAHLRQKTFSKEKLMVHTTGGS
jgi:hypothetical protein